VKNIDLLAKNFHTVTQHACSNRGFEPENTTFKKTAKATLKTLYQSTDYGLKHHFDKIQNHDFSDEILRYSKKIFF